MSEKIGQPMTTEEFERAKVFMPNIAEVVAAGDTLVIHARDPDGNPTELAVTGRECDETLAFLVAFDAYWVARKSGITQGVSLDALWYQVEETWKGLPMHIIQQMPSFKQLRRSVG